MNQDNLTALSERGMNYPDGTKTKVFRGELFVLPPDSADADVYKLPLGISAEVWEDRPFAQTPFDENFKPGLHIPEANEATEIVTNAETFAIISTMDKKFVGTKNYMGRAYFWNYAFRHTLRDASAAQLVQVHDAFIANGLPLDGDTPAHRQIINLVFKSRKTGL